MMFKRTAKHIEMKSHTCQGLESHGINNLRKKTLIKTCSMYCILISYLYLKWNHCKYYLISFQIDNLKKKIDHFLRSFGHLTLPPFQQKEHQNNQVKKEIQ